MIDILHLTDLHFGKNGTELFTDVDQLATSIHAAALPYFSSERSLVVSGDLIYGKEASAYPRATRFMAAMAKICEIPQNRIIVCPGNHDIASGPNHFGAFDRAVFSVTGNSRLAFGARKNVVITTDAAEFIVLNSAFHGDHHFGLVSLDGLSAPRTDNLQVIVVHHNLLGAFKGDTSTIRNAFELASFADASGVRAILHGHQHMRQILSIGSTPCAIVGGGSLNFKMLHPVSNQFNLIHMDKRQTRVLRFAFHSDALVSGRIGGWVLAEDVTVPVTSS